MSEDNIKSNTEKEAKKPREFPALSITQLADLTGKHYRTIKKKVETVKPSNLSKKYPLWDPREVLPVIFDVQLDGVKLDINQENAKLSQIKQRKELIRLEEMEGSLIPLDVIDKYQTQIFTAFRAKILSLPSKLSPMLASITDARKIEDELIREHHEALEELSNYEPAREGSGFISEDDEEESSGREASAEFND